MTAATEFVKDSALALAADIDPDFVQLAGEAYGRVTSVLFHYRNAHEDVADTLHDTTWAWDQLASNLGVPVPTHQEAAETASHLGLQEGEYTVVEPTRSENTTPIHERLTENFPQVDSVVKQAIAQLTMLCLGLDPELAPKVIDATGQFLDAIGVHATEEQIANANVGEALEHVLNAALGLNKRDAA